MKSITLILPLLLMVQACARLLGPPAPPPLAPDEIKRCLAFVQEQQTRVEAFYALGTLQAQKHLSRSESRFLIAGTRRPFRIKIELTHPWGQPLLHLLIEGDDVRVLAPAEKRLYVGKTRDAALSKYLPGVLERDQLWGFLRGLPSPVPYRRAASSEADQIDLFDEQGSIVQSMDLDPNTRAPGRVIYPDRGIRITFSQFIQAEAALYASRITLTDSTNGVRLERQVHQMVMNQPIPEEIFTLAVPPGYQTLPLE